MLINSSLRRSHGHRGSQAGTALMEFIFALPFLLFILILSVNFGRAFLMRQRAVMAIRYVAFADLHRQALPTDSEMSKMFFQGEAVRVLSSSGSGSQDAGTPSGLAPDSSGMAGVMNSLSGTKSYEVQVSYRPVFAAGDYWGDGKDKWFPPITFSSKLTMDSSDWRHGEMSIWQLVSKVFGGVWDGLKSLFH